MSKVAAKVAGGTEGCLLPQREQFLPYWIDLTLDADTAYSKIKVYENQKTVMLTDETQTDDVSSKRFLYVPQVLCNQPLSGKKYWEVEWEGPKGAGIAVSYASIAKDTAGDECRFGCNCKSWRFQDGVHRDFLYNDLKTIISSHFNVIGVFIDVEEGILRFYSITPDREEMKLLYDVPSFQATEDLYAGFWLSEGTKLSIPPKQVAKSCQRT
ncbi:stonustoxin subunit beta-like [Scomber scombrus]|uniref:stonustoxin subunit beta-like n=1 Tax=Scomber scombrus TaxID=13677 RepID=UPI002DD978C5|nr:stonustoxin subunit beta-like [Scomber scombrus]